MSNCKNCSFRTHPITWNLCWTPTKIMLVCVRILLFGELLHAYLKNVFRFQPKPQFKFHSLPIIQKPRCQLISRMTVTANLLQHLRLTNLGAMNSQQHQQPQHPQYRHKWTVADPINNHPSLQLLHILLPLTS